jgi:hypothetical protein
MKVNRRFAETHCLLHDQEESQRREVDLTTYRYIPEDTKLATAAKISKSNVLKIKK